MQAMRNTFRSSSIRVPVLVAASLVASASGGARPVAARPASQAVKADAAREAYMQGHFAQVMAVHEAVIRGDLVEAHRLASWLATQGGPDSLPAGSAPHVAAMREAAGRTAAASSVLEAALGTAAMLKTCGDCHRAVGTMPAAPLELPLPAGRKIVGHMLAHQHAADQMLQGLVVPSNSLWRQGASDLSTPPLDDDLKGDAKLGREAKASERRIHVLAGEARRVEAPAARAVFYAQILARCADCHASHPNVWGPSRR
jgi:hypothetical protein